MSDYAFFFLDAGQQNMFNVLRAALFRHAELIPIQELDVDLINMAFKAVLTDTPEIFWFEGRWEVVTVRGARHIHPLYTVSIAESRRIQDQLEEMRSAILGGREFAGEADRVRYAYDWLISNVNYGLLNGKGQTINDALVKRYAVCKGLSKGLQYLLKRMGCFSTLQEGTLDGRGRHVWNIVKVDGNYYNVDVSMGYERFAYLFDDEQGYDKYRCFLVSNAQLSKYHRIYRLPWPSLDCDHGYLGES